MGKSRKTLIFHPYTPQVRLADQWYCWEALAHLSQAGWDKQVHVPCFQPLDYARRLQAIWAKGWDIIIVEHDIAPSIPQVTLMETCQSDFCAQDYWLPNGDLWSHLATEACFGLCRITLAAQRLVVPTPQVPQVTWRELASTLSPRLPPWHLHTQPADHHHTEGP